MRWLLVGTLKRAGGGSADTAGRRDPRGVPQTASSTRMHRERMELAPFVLAHHRVYGNVDHALALLAGLVSHLDEGCIGSISEIMDAILRTAPGLLCPGLECV